MSFQDLIDNAANISIIRRPVVAQTVSRGNVVRSVSRGGNVWRFEVKLPDGPRWTDYRGFITSLENLDRTETGTFSFNNSGHSWLVGYQGNLANISNITVSIPTSGNTVTITGGASGLSAGQFIFRKGDFIQLGNSGRVYTVVEDVPYNGSTITLHRPLLDSAGNTTLNVAENCAFTVICTQFPNWTLFARDQVSWDGNFVLTEVI
jgi:hypothetical protein